MKYVVGFMFNPERDKVALIRKTKPKWQAGLLNGIGGKVEIGEFNLDSMLREFNEETGYCTLPETWHHFATLAEGDSWVVDFFFTHGDLTKLKSMEEEKVEIVLVSEIGLRRKDMVENLPWLIALALDSIEDGRPVFASISY